MGPCDPYTLVAWWCRNALSAKGSCSNVYHQCLALWQILLNVYCHILFRHLPDFIPGHILMNIHGIELFLLEHSSHSIKRDTNVRINNNVMFSVSPITHAVFIQLCISGSMFLLYPGSTSRQKNTIVVSWGIPLQQEYKQIWRKSPACFHWNYVCLFSLELCCSIFIKNVWTSWSNLLWQFVSLGVFCIVLYMFKHRKYSR